MDTAHLLNEAIEQTVDLFALLDGDGNYTYCNAAYARALGDRESLRGSSALSDIHPEDRARVKDLLSMSERGMPARLFEYRLIDQRAYVHYCEGRLESLERILPGSKHAFLFVSRFVTRSQMRDTQVAHSTEDKLRTILDAFQEGIVLIDAAGVVTFVNERAAAIFGFLPSALIGKDASRVLPMEYLQNPAATSSSSANDGTPTRMVVFRKAGRANVTQEVRLQQFQEPGMKHPGTLVFLRDAPHIHSDTPLLK